MLTLTILGCLLQLGETCKMSIAAAVGAPASTAAPGFAAAAGATGCGPGARTTHPRRSLARLTQCYVALGWREISGSENRLSVTPQSRHLCRHTNCGGRCSVQDTVITSLFSALISDHQINGLRRVCGLWRPGTRQNDRWETIDFHEGLRHSARIV